MQTSFKESDFDNRVTRTYRVANTLGVPTKYVYYDSPKTKESEPKSATWYIANTFSSKTLESIYNDLNKNGLDINPIDLSLLYCNTLKSIGNLDSVKSIANKVNGLYTYVEGKDAILIEPEKLMANIEAKMANMSDVDQQVLVYIKSFSGKSLEIIYNEIKKFNPTITHQYIGIIYAVGRNQDWLSKLVEKLVIKVNTFYEYINTNIKTTKTRSVKIQTYSIVDDLAKQMDIYHERYNNLIAKEARQYKIYVSNQKQLVKIDPIQHDEPVIETSIVGYDVKWSTKADIVLEDGDYVFSTATPSFAVPYIQYINGNGESKVHIYQGNNENNDVPDFENITKKAKKEEPHSFRIAVCTSSDPFGQPLKKKSYITITYSIKKGVIKIPSPTDTNGVEMMKKRIELAFPNLLFHNPRELEIRGYFIMKNPVIIDAVLHYLFINNSLFRSYVFTDNKNTPRCEKVRHHMFYKSSDIDESSTRSSGYCKRPSAMSPVSLSFGDVKGSNVTAFNRTNGDSTIRVKINKASNTKVLKEFIQIFTRLMTVYEENKDFITHIFRIAIPGSCMKTRDAIANGGATSTIMSSVVSSTPKRTKSGKTKRVVNNTRNISKNNNLQIKAPQVFVNNYCKQCACFVQPIIIPDDEVEDWENLLVTNRKGVKVKRKVADFPPLNPYDSTFKPLFKFVCTDNVMSSPHYKEQKTKVLPNAKEFPYLPCCKMAPTDVTPKMYWDKFNNNNDGVKKKNYRSSTGAVSTDSEGDLNPQIFNILKFSVEGQNDPDLIRLGIQESPNSLIHCVLQAINYPGYRELRSLTDREEFARQARSYMAKAINPMVYKQEMYDKTLLEIYNKIDDMDYPLDPSLFYRGLEEAFNVNIYTFNDNQGINKITGKTDERPFLEVPNSKMFHVRHMRNGRKTVLIYKSPSNSSSRTQNFHCTLIISKGDIIKRTKRTYGVSQKNNGDERQSFGDKMANTMFQILRTTVNSYIWSFTDEENEIFETRNSVFNDIIWKNILSNYKIIGQRVDGYGRVSVIAFNAIDSLGKEHTVMITTPPTQPLNVPNIDTIVPTTYEIVSQIFDNPVMRTPNGVWYNIMDYETGIFVLCSDPDQDIQEGKKTEPIHDERVKTVNPVTQMVNAKKNSMILLELIKWSWSLSKREPIEIWWQKFVHSTGEEKSSAVPNIGIRLPIARSSHEAFAELHKGKWWPDYFRMDGIYLYESLYQKCKAYFKRYEQEFDGEKYTIPTHITGVKSKDADFESKPNSIIFTDSKHLNNWLEYKRTETDYNFINSVVTSEMSTQTHPYLLKHGIHVYLVQNVRNNSFRRAAQVVNHWFTNHINKGYDIEEDELFNINFPYVIYGIGKSNKLTPIVNKTRNLTSYAEFLGYTFTTHKGEVVSGNIAAMIPLN